MFNTKLPTLNELPSSKQLLRSTVIALIAAMVLLVTVVMPSEYAIDPTGMGRALGLTQMGEVKVQLAEEAAADALATNPVSTAEASAPAIAQPAPVESVKPEVAPAEPVVEVPASQEPVPEPTGQQHEMSITLEPNQGAEVKLEMVAGPRSLTTGPPTGARSTLIPMEILTTLPAISTMAMARVEQRRRIKAFWRPRLMVSTAGSGGIGPVSLSR